MQLLDPDTCIVHWPYTIILLHTSQKLTMSSPKQPRHNPCHQSSGSNVTDALPVTQKSMILFSTYSSQMPEPIIQQPHEFADEFVTQKPALSDATLGRGFRADISGKVARSSPDATPTGPRAVLDNVHVTAKDLKPKEEAEAETIPKRIKIK
ncbi:hypothetical protein DOTSEDRAFT_68861 [Dothistroma septosporum NZE10]|uniref:Uncharacterized protein n=1 Tax=Dothistroma septosporum (strain NZE10 / CBS 128990) TaxID=675120 RepID=N1Q546_DOTSN|nr:hypothetical protein DOTSEDRAFT_68861 [Dothistroma septosporum NZE10]